MPHLQANKIIFRKEPHTHAELLLRNVILGGQDGLVNVLGILLGVAIATDSFHIVILAALAATFAESISMGAVAYTSGKSAIEYYIEEREREKREMRTMPDVERKEVRDIYARRGFSGHTLDMIVKKICSKKSTWLEVMMEEELKLEKPTENPVHSAIVVGISAIIGSFLPIIPFFFLPVKLAIVATVIFSGIVLFTAGALKSKFTIIGWKRSGAEIAVIGIVSALVGFAIGVILGA